MDKKCEELGEKLAGFIVKRDFNGVRTLLAPWLQASLGAAAIEKMVKDASEGLEHPPSSWVLDEGLAELPDLQEPNSDGPPSQKIAKDITDKNFRAWFAIQFVPEEPVHEEQNVCFDLWVLAVEHNGVFLAGYLEAAEAT